MMDCEVVFRCTLCLEKHYVCSVNVYLNFNRDLKLFGEVLDVSTLLLAIPAQIIKILIGYYSLELAS